MANTDLIVPVVTAQLKISLVSNSKCVPTVLKDSNITTLTITVLYVLCTESLIELVDYKVHAWKNVLQQLIVNSGLKKTTLVPTAPDISI